MITTSEKLFGPAQLTNAAATKYTVPPSTTAAIRRMRVSNPTGGAVTFTLSIGADAAGTRLYDAVSIPAGGALDIRGPFSLATGEIVQASASANTSLVLEIDGTETRPPMLLAVLNSSTARGFGLAPFTFPVDASIYCWGAVLLAAINATDPNLAALVLISKNGNSTTSALPGGDPGYTVDDAEAYFGAPLTHLIVQFQVNANTPAQNITNLQTIYNAATALGTQVWVTTPHPVLAGTFTAAEVDDMILQRDLVFSTFGSRAIDAWTFNVLPNGRDANPAQLVDDRHWNAQGHIDFKAVVKAATGLG